MSVSPILPGRLPGTLLASRLLGSIQKTQAELTRLQDMASTGQRYFRPGENPASAAQTILLQREIERNAQLMKNVQTDRSLLAASDAAFAPVSDALAKLKSFASAGVGDSTTLQEKQAMASELRGLLQGVIAAGNTTFRGRSLFGGAMTQGTPFDATAGGAVIYRGDAAAIGSDVGAAFVMANNVDGATAFAALTPPVSADLDPTLTPDTRLSNLNGGTGVTPGPIRVTVADGVNPNRVMTVDLTGAETVGDVQARIAAAFPAGPLGLGVALNGSGNGLRLTPTAGPPATVAVADVAGGAAAAQLGIASTAATSITGADLNPALSLGTRLADLNGGSGVGLAGGLRIVSGTKAATVDLTGAVTVEDALNAIRSQSQAAGIEVAVGLTDDGAGIAVSSRMMGESFSVGENGGDTAKHLGLRTLTGETRLADLNRGLGVPVAAPNRLQITRRDGSQASIDLSGAKTIQDVIAAIDATGVPPLSAEPNAVGNGITIVDGSGTGPLVIEGAIAEALGIAGRETGADPTVGVVGKDVNPQESNGVIHLMIRLEDALRTGNTPEINRLAPLIEAEGKRFLEVRGDVASRLQSLDGVEDRALDREIALKQALQGEFEIDIAEVVTEVAYRQATLEATLKISAQSMSMLLINYL